MTDPTLPPGARGPGVVRSYEGRDGRILRYREVSPAAPLRAASRRLVYLHGIESHGAWFLPVAERLAARGHAVFLVDRRGSGLNRGEEPGDATSVEILLDDVRRFRRHLGAEPVVLAGLSWGGKLATAAAIDDPPGLEGLVLVTPALRVRIDLTFARKLAVIAGAATGGRNRIPVPIEPEMFTRVEPFLGYVRADPARLHEATARFFLASRALDRRVRRDVHRLDLPVLLFLAGDDRIVDNAAVVELLSALPAGRLTVERFEGASHSIQFERTDPLAEAIARFLERRTKAG